MGDQQVEREKVMSKLLRVTAPHFCAGAVYEKQECGWECVKAAPILKWVIGKPPHETRDYLNKRQWAHEWVKAGGQDDTDSQSSN